MGGDITVLSLSFSAVLYKLCIELQLKLTLVLSHCSEFCQHELSKRDFKSAVDRLNANVLHLCFTQVRKRRSIILEESWHSLSRQFYGNIFLRNTISAIMHQSHIKRFWTRECYRNETLQKTLFYWRAVNSRWFSSDFLRIVSQSWRRAEITSGTTGWQ